MVPWIAPASPAHHDDGADNSSEDDALSDNSDELHPETGFDPFLTATRRARQQSVDASNSLSLPAVVTPMATESYVSEAQRWHSIAKYWGKVVDQAMFFPKQGRIDLSSRHITDIAPIIADLSRYVSLAPPRYDDKEDDDQQDGFPHFKTGGFSRHVSQIAPYSGNNGGVGQRRTLSRSQSAFQPSTRAHSFARTDSAASGVSSRSAASYRDHRDKQATLSLFLGSNALTKLPSALFQLHNLRVLSLRSNKLKHLPPAIGDLQNLSELQIANNEFEYLPAEILRLKLDVFTWFPNPYLAKPPKSGLLTVRPLLSHKTQYNQQLTMSKLIDVTPIKEEASEHEALHPPPVLRPPPVAGRQRSLDRTRSDMQVEHYLDRGFERLRADRLPLVPGNEAPDDDTQSSIADTETESNRASAVESADSEEAQRQRILEAAFEEEESDDTPFGETTMTDNDSTFLRGKVVGRSRVLGQKEVIAGLPSLTELCIRKLLSPYDVTLHEADRGASPFLSPVMHSAGGLRRRNSSRSASRASTPQFGPSMRSRATSFGSASRSFSSNGGPEDSRIGKRVPTLLEAYENGTLQSVVGQVSRGLVSILEAARRSATSDWGTKARMPRKSATTKKTAFVRTQSHLGAFPADDEPDKNVEAPTGTTEVDDEDDCDLFGSIDAPGSLDRGDDANQNPWFSRCPNPKHCEEAESSAPRGSWESLRNRHGFGSSSSVSSLGTTLGRSGLNKIDTLDPGHESSASASSDGGHAGRHSPISQTSSHGTVGHGAETGSVSSLASGPMSQVRFSPSTSNQRTWSSSRPLAPRGMAQRPNSTNFVRGFSTLSVLSASNMRSSSFAGAAMDTDADRDWPLSEVQHRAAPIFSKAGETRLEWISHIGGIKVAKLNDAHVDLDQQAATDAEEHRSLLGTMTPFENKDLIPILWRGCAQGCLDFLI